jgi:hypothetical protein
MLATGGGWGEEKFTVVPYRNCTFSTKFLKKTWKFPNKKDTFGVNLVFTATLPCTKRALFITKKGSFHHKKGTYSPLKKFGVAGAPRALPGSNAPAQHCDVSDNIWHRLKSNALICPARGCAGVYID